MKCSSVHLKTKLEPLGFKCGFTPLLSDPFCAKYYLFVAYQRNIPLNHLKAIHSRERGLIYSLGSSNEVCTYVRPTPGQCNFSIQNIFSGFAQKYTTRQSVESGGCWRKWRFNQNSSLTVIILLYYFRFNEDCQFSNCNYREHQTHFHCMRKDCNYRFCDKTR